MEPTVSWLHLFNRHCISIGGPTCHVTDEETDTGTGHQWAAACRDVAGEPSGKTEGTGRICPYRRVGAHVSCAAQARGDVDGKSVHVAMLVTLRHCIKKCNYVTDRADYIASPSTDHGKLMRGIHELPCRLEPFPEKRKRPEHAGCSGFEVIVGVLHSNQRPSAVCVSLLVYGLSAIPKEFASGFAACSAIPGT